VRKQICEVQLIAQEQRVRSGFNFSKKKPLWGLPESSRKTVQLCRKYKGRSSLIPCSAGQGINTASVGVDEVKFKVCACLEYSVIRYTKHV
jgi:hypothetical protein